MSRIFLSFFLLLPFLTNISAQQSDIVELEKKLLQTTPDTNKVKILNNLSGAYQESNPGKGIDYALESLKLANELRWNKGMVISYRHIGNCYFYKSDPDNAIIYFYKSLHLAEKINEYILQNDALYSLSFVYADDNHKDYSTALYFRLKSLKLNEKIGDKSGTLQMLMIVGYTYTKVGKYDTAVRYYVHALNLRKATGDTSYLEVYQNIGLALQFQTKWKEAIQYYQMGITEALSRGYKAYAGQLLRSIGDCYQNQQDYTTALKNFEKALSIFQEIKDMYWQGLTLNSIGKLYSDKKDYFNAIKYSLQSLDIAESIKSKELTVENEKYLSAYYLAIQDFDKGLDLALRAASILEKLNDNENLSFLYSTIASIYKLKGDTSKAEFYNKKSKISDRNINNDAEYMILYLQGIDCVNDDPVKSLSLFQHTLLLSKKANDKRAIAFASYGVASSYLSILDNNKMQLVPVSYRFSSKRKCLSYIINLMDSAIKIDAASHEFNKLQAYYGILSKAYEEKKDFQQALENYRKSTFYKDSVLNIDTVRKITRLEGKIELNKKDSTIKQAEFKSAIERSHAKTVAIILVSLLSVVVISWIVYYFLHKRKKYKAQLELLKTKLQVSDYERQLADSKLEIADAKLQAIDAKQEALNAQMSDHFVGNVMHSIEIFMDNNDKVNATMYLDRFRQLTRRVIKNAPKKLITLKEDLEVLKDFIELEKLRFTAGTFSYQLIVHPDVEPDSALLPPMVMQVLTENAIKHGFDKTLGGNLEIEITKEGNLLRCIVQDNGIGRKAAGETKRKDTESFGTSLAERLIRLSSYYSEQTSYKITDLFDVDELPVGTRVEIILPYILNEENV